MDFPIRMYCASTNRDIKSALTEERLAAQGVDTNNSGTIYFDDFESRRFSYIGTLTDPGVDDPTATNQLGWFARTSDPHLPPPNTTMKILYADSNCVSSDLGEVPDRAGGVEIKNGLRRNVRETVLCLPFVGFQEFIP